MFSLRKSKEKLCFLVLLTLFTQDIYAVKNNISFDTEQILLIKNNTSQSSNKKNKANSYSFSTQLKKRYQNLSKLQKFLTISGGIIIVISAAALTVYGIKIYKNSGKLSSKNNSLKDTDFNLEGASDQLEVLYEYENCIAFKALVSRKNALGIKVHTIIKPKTNYSSFDDFVKNSSPENVGNFFKNVEDITRRLKLDGPGYRLVINHGKDIQVSPQFQVNLLGWQTNGHNNTNSPKYDPNNPFTKILQGQLPANVIDQDSESLIFQNHSYRAPVSLLAIPKKDCVSFTDFVQNSSSIEIGSFFKKIAVTAQTLNLTDSGYRLITNHGANANQSVFHFHVHLLGWQTNGRTYNYTYNPMNGQDFPYTP